MRGEGGQILVDFTGYEAIHISRDCLSLEDGFFDSFHIRGHLPAVPFVDHEELMQRGAAERINEPISDRSAGLVA